MIKFKILFKNSKEEYYIYYATISSNWVVWIIHRIVEKQAMKQYIIVNRPIDAHRQPLLNTPKNLQQEASHIYNWSRENLKV